VLITKSNTERRKGQVYFDAQIIGLEELNFPMLMRKTSRHHQIHSYAMAGRVQEEILYRKAKTTITMQMVTTTDADAQEDELQQEQKRQGVHVECEKTKDCCVPTSPLFC
jgi:hypothetical protein